MRTYRQYCPVARASEIMAERWTPLVVRNLLWGATTFSAIARGVPSMSRSVLIKRLDELARAGVVEIRPKERGRGSTYTLTPAGRDLAAVIDSLAAWGERWLDVTSEHTDPAFALWVWVELELDRRRLPARRVVVGFTFPDEPPTNRRYWLLVENGDAELCYADPGGEVDVEVTAESEAFTRWHTGEVGWAEARRDGSIVVSGPRQLAAALPTWHLRRDVVESAPSHAMR